MKKLFSKDSERHSRVREENRTIRQVPRLDVLKALEEEQRR